MGFALRCVRDGVSEDRNRSVSLFDTHGCGGDWIHRLFVLSEKEIINDACTDQSSLPMEAALVFYIEIALLIAIGVVANTKVTVFGALCWHTLHMTLSLFIKEEYIS